MEVSARVERCHGLKAFTFITVKTTPFGVAECQIFYINVVFCASFDNLYFVRLMECRFLLRHWTIGRLLEC